MGFVSCCSRGVGVYKGNCRHHFICRHRPTQTFLLCKKYLTIRCQIDVYKEYLQIEQRVRDVFRSVSLDQLRKEVRYPIVLVPFDSYDYFCVRR